MRAPTHRRPAGGCPARPGRLRAELGRVRGLPHGGALHARASGGRAAGTAPSVGFVHGLLARTAGLLGQVHDRIRALIILAHAVCCDETPLRVGSRTPRPGKKKAERYLLVACTELYTHYLLGDRSLDTFKAFVLAERAQRGAIVVHDRYQNYDCAEFFGLIHQLCCQHLLRDLDDAAQVHPDKIWPGQVSRALRELIHQANLARDAGEDHIDPQVLDTLTSRFRHGVRAGLSDTTGHGSRPGERKARLLLEALRDRQADILRFAHDLAVPPTSNQAERDLRPSKCQQNISGRLTSEARPEGAWGAPTTADWKQLGAYAQCSVAALVTPLYCQRHGPERRASRHHA